MISDELAGEWREAGLRNGDTVLVHSRLDRTLRRYLKAKKKISVQDVFDSFLKAVGTEGTLLFPLFNFDFTKGIPFDFRETPSQMGALTEMGRLHPGAVRTGHPIYSFAAVGRQAERLRDINNFSGYGADSPFAILRELNGKIAVLNLPDQHSMTFYHHVEEMLEVPYRYHKTFTGEYRDKTGHTARRTFGLFVRNIERGVMTQVNPAGELLWEKNLYRGHRPDQESGLRIIEAQKLFSFVSDIITSGKANGLLYKIEPKV